ncbi:MAG: hypothetical protein FJ189_04165, partial [Gammaproteobacteria bacterium]|nr:hypothetical protein [Gammaproteobacteria bacterium]
MKVVEVSVDGGSGHQPLNQAWSLDTPTEGEGRRYQRRLRFELPTGGLAEELLLSEATELRLEAYPYAFDALSVHAPETATVERTVDHQGLLVTFPVARLIRSVRFRASAAALGKMTQVFRTDGDVIAEQPVASTLNAFPFMGLSASGTRVRSIAVEGPVTAARAASPAPRAGSVGAAETALFVAAVSAPTGGGELDVLDRRVVLRLAGGAGFSTLAVHDLEQVQLATEPENMRAGVCVPSLGAEVFFLPLTFNPGQPVQAGAALRGQLTTLLRRLQEKTAQDGIGGELPDPVTVELLLESDAPCRVVISQSGIDYLLARHSFPDGA